MNPEIEHLEAARAQLDAASRQAGKELLLATAPAAMTLVGWLALRKQRKAVRARLAALAAVEAEAYDPPAGDGPASAAGDRPAGDREVLDGLEEFVRHELEDDEAGEHNQL